MSHELPKPDTLMQYLTPLRLSSVVHLANYFHTDPKDLMSLIDELECSNRIRTINRRCGSSCKECPSQCSDPACHTPDYYLGLVVVSREKKVAS